MNEPLLHPGELMNYKAKTLEFVRGASALLVPPISVKSHGAQYYQASTVQKMVLAYLPSQMLSDALDTFYPTFEVH